MAEDEQKKAAEDEQKPAAETIKKGAGMSSKLKLIIIAVLGLAVVGGSAAVGGFMAHHASAETKTKTPDQPANEPAAVEEEHVPAEIKSGVQYAYVEMEPIIVNLDEPRLARYIRASIVLAVKGENAKAVNETVEKKKPELKSWLTVYMAGCSLEDVRGPKNLNRICREIRESFNDQLWPGSKPMIEKVLLKEFAVQ
jgi:flagellar basal body-associated protein FliL